MNIRKKLIQGGIRNMKEFGYPSVTESNIMIDEFYATFFRNMLRQQKHDVIGEGLHNNDTGKEIIKTIDEMLNEININMQG